MAPTFIKLQAASNPDSSFYLNVQHITYMGVKDDGSSTLFRTVDGTSFEAHGDCSDLMFRYAENGQALALAHGN